MTARSRRLGAFLIRITEKTPRATSTATAKKSSMKPSTGLWPNPQMAKFFLKRSPYASMIVKNRTVKPQNVKAWASPGTVQRKSFFCPPTSTSSASARTRRLRTRSGAG